MTEDTMTVEVKASDFARYEKFCRRYDISSRDCLGYFMDWLNIYDLESDACSAQQGISLQLLRAAELGDTGAQYELGMYYLFGVGVGVDYQEAVFWLEKVAEKGYAKAQFQAGMCYYRDYDDNLESERCAYWFEKAATQGHAKAEYMYGYCYLIGQGVEQDFDKAEYWIRKAAADGDADAKWTVDTLYDRPKGVELPVLGW